MSSIDDFLSYFPGKHVYCSIDDKGINKGLVHYHEGYNLSRSEILVELSKLNQDSNGIFFCVNEIDRNRDPNRQRTKVMLCCIRAVWADDDNVRPEPRTDFPIPPNIVVETSPGKFHYYWLTNTDNLIQWGQVMNNIINQFDCDGNAKDLVRVLRLPGFQHHKNESFRSHAYLGSKEPYDWQAIIQAFPLNDAVSSTSRVNNVPTHSNIQFADYTAARNSIITATNFHGAIMWTLNHWVNNGMRNEKELFDLIMDLMNQSQVQDERWEARTNTQYITNNIRDALNFVNENPVIPNIQLTEQKEIDTQLDVGYPPGMMGDLCKEIFEMAPHPNQEIALMAGFSLIAGITGRSFNVLGAGLNIYVALLADSGVGKANLKDSINKILFRHCILEGGPRFKGAMRFTGPKPLFEMLSKGLSRVCILEESGLMSESTAGDQKGLTRVMLDIFSSSGKGQYAGGESYSKEENSVPVIHSPALTIAHVSTPLSYLRALKAKDATVSGDIARVWMMRTLRPKQYLEINRRDKLSDPLLERIKELCRICSPQQEMENSNQIIDIDVSNIDIQTESNWWTDQENEHRKNDDQLRRSLCSRSFMKILKISSIASVMNGKHSIGVDEYNWAKKAVIGEITTIENALSIGSSDDLMQIFKNIVVPTVIKILQCKFKDKKKIPPKTLHGKGIFTNTNLGQSLRNNEVFKRLSDDPERPNPKTGFEKMITFMIRQGLIVRLNEEQLKKMGAKTKVAFQVTDDFLLLMEDDKNG